jgi:hypothetical protein
MSGLQMLGEQENLFDADGLQGVSARKEVRWLMAAPQGLGRS